MDLLRTIAVYLTIVYASSVQSTPMPSVVLDLTAPVVTATVQADPTSAPTNTPIPTPSIVPSDAYDTLRSGDRGDEVRAMQEKLASYGYYIGDIDGSYGNQTYEAVRSFQEKHGLSRDGIAGKVTLTVLFESDEVRSLIAPTPAPTPVKSPDQIAVASNSVTLTPAVTQTPTMTPVITQTPQPTVAVTVTPAPTEKMKTVEAMKEYIIRIEGQSKAVVADPEASEVQEALLPYLVDEELFVPLKPILENAGIMAIEMQTDALVELAFPLGDNVFRVTYRAEQANTPIDLHIFQNTEPQILPNRTMIQVGDEVYIAAQTLQKMMGFSFAVDEDQKEVKVSLPVQSSEIQ